MKQVSGLIAGLTGLVVSLIGLGVAGQIVFGNIMGLNVIGNITDIVDSLSSGGFVGLVVLLILWGQVK
ncbi:MAG: hypothetical protein ABGW65_04465 [Marinoscillum sp.]